MILVFSILIFLLGVFLLLKGADFLVDGSSSLARKFGVSSLAVGLTVVAFGTSLPETVVNVCASIQGQPDITFGNVIGSNICNILLILGVCACISKIPIKKSTSLKEIPIAFLAALSFFLCSNKIFLFNSKENLITRFDGFILLSIFAMFLFYIYRMVKNKEIDIEENNNKIEPSNLKIFLWISSGLAFLCLGGKFTVDSAVDIARKIGLSELFISSSIIAVGTSLPELLTSVVAVLKKEMNIAVGNIVGSNIFNILFIMPISAFIVCLPVPKYINYDFYFMFFATILLFLFSLSKKHQLNIYHGIFFLLSYASYITFLMIRG